MTQRQLVQFKVCLFGADLIKDIWTLWDTAHHHCLYEITPNWHVRAQTATATEVNRLSKCVPSVLTLFFTSREKKIGKNKTKTCALRFCVSNLGAQKLLILRPIPILPCIHISLKTAELTICLPLDGSKNVWAARVKVKLSAETDVRQLFPCVTLKVSRKKKGDILTDWIQTAVNWGSSKRQN